jgi:two-component system response regulator PilR (NtrC family)
MSKVLIVDDELSMREFLEIFFRKRGHTVQTAADGDAGIKMLFEEEFDLVLTDLRMPRTHGMVVLEKCRELYPDTPVIVMTAYATTQTAIDAMKMGAYDYLTKPFKLDNVSVTIEKALERRRLVAENRKLKDELRSRGSFPNLIGKSRAMQEVLDLVRRVANTPTNVLILGESGTGKELVARAIHEHSDRGPKPFLVVNCGAIPENLLESELFGHRKGAFTGASSDKEGIVRAAHGGTLFLDEVGELPLSMQVKLLRVLQERSVKAIGDVREQPVDLRVIAATNRNLEEEVRGGRFRDDLFYRLNVISIELPPLRDRPEDIPLLAHHFLRKYAEMMNKPLDEFEPEAMQALVHHGFAGNVRELENIIQRAVALEDDDRVSSRALPPTLRPRSPSDSLQDASLQLPQDGVDLEGVVGELERKLIMQALQRTGGLKKEAAKLLGISFRSLRYRLDKLAVQDNPPTE